MRPERGTPAVSKTAAVAIATRFTADVLSWDEDAPEVHVAALCAYADDPHPTTAGTPPPRAGRAGVANVSTSSSRPRRCCAWQRASSWCH